MGFVMTWDGWDRLHIHGRLWLQKRADGLIFLKLVARNGLGMDVEADFAADTRECDIYAYMLECNQYW